MVLNEEVTLNVCRTCHIVKPPRSFHCSSCKACIEVHDHHCPWVGTCVGKRNHKWFLMFALFTSLHAIFTMVLDIFFLDMGLYIPDTSEDRSSDHNAAIGLAIYTGMITLCVGGLCCYHTKLAVKGETTNEDIRAKYLTSGNPYNLGVRKNCNAFCNSGKSRITEKEYNTEALSKVESNVFVI